MTGDFAFTRPRFKSREDRRQSIRLTANGFGIRPNGRLYVPKSATCV